MIESPFIPENTETVDDCPWCNSPDRRPWGQPVRGFLAVVCTDCNIIYIKNRLNEKGLIGHYQTYMTDRHQASAQLTADREKMYEIEFAYIDQLVGRGSVLDVGCSGGFFLDHFADNGYDCFGVEFAEKAAIRAAARHDVVQGIFTDLDFSRKFDLVVFRGVLEHVPDPRGYLNKAVSLLAEGGSVFITSTPNRDAVSCDLFEENWNQFSPEEHMILFGVQQLDTHFASVGMTRVASHFFYEETPYANPEDDILQVAEAISRKRLSDPVNFKSPSFWGNMMSVVYRAGGSV